MTEERTLTDRISNRVFGVPAIAQLWAKFSARSTSSLVDLSAQIPFAQLHKPLSLCRTALLTTGLTLLAGSRAQDESESFSLALRAVRDVCAEIQEQANQPNNLPQFEGIGAVYVTHNGTTRNVAVLPAGSVTITCYADEATVPAVFGGPQDLNFDGDSNDNLAGQSNGSDMQLIPAEITVSFTDDRGTVTQTFHRRFAQTTD
jgi:hypothetical protein